MIRALEKTDVPRIAEIHVFAQRTVYRGFVPDEFLFGKMTVHKRIEYFYENETEGHVFDDGFIKGFITLGPCKDADKPGCFELYRIFVDPLIFGQGIGGKLAAHAEKVAKEQGHNEIYLWVLEGNKNARSFYDRLGYVADGAVRISGYFGVPEVRYIKRV